MLLPSLWCAELFSRNLRTHERNRHGAQRSKTSSATQERMHKAAASNVCPLACPSCLVPSAGFFVFLISCWGRHCRLAPALETSLLMGEEDIRVACLTKPSAHSGHLSLFCLASPEKMLNLPRTESSQGLQRVLTGQRRQQCLESVLVSQVLLH